MPANLILALLLVAYIAAGASWIYNGWSQWDRRRRSERRVHLNLKRMGGGR